MRKRHPFRPRHGTIGVPSARPVSKESREDVSRHRMLEGELKKLYVAITRAKVNVLIYDEGEALCKKLKTRLSDSGATDVGGIVDPGAAGVALAAGGGESNASRKAVQESNAKRRADIVRMREEADLTFQADEARTVLFEYWQRQGLVDVSLEDDGAGDDEDEEDQAAALKRQGKTPEDFYHKGNEFAGRALYELARNCYQRAYQLGKDSAWPKVEYMWGKLLSQRAIALRLFTDQKSMQAAQLARMQAARHFLYAGKTLKYISQAAISLFQARQWEAALPLLEVCPASMRGGMFGEAEQVCRRKAGKFSDLATQLEEAGRGFEAVAELKKARLYDEAIKMVQRHAGQAGFFRAPAGMRGRPPTVASLAERAMSALPKERKRFAQMLPPDEMVELLRTYGETQTIVELLLARSERREAALHVLASGLAGVGIGLPTDLNRARVVKGRAPLEVEEGHEAPLAAAQAADLLLTGALPLKLEAAAQSADSVLALPLPEAP